MVNDINKLDQAGSAILAVAQLQQPTAKAYPTDFTQDEDVTVTNHLSKLVTLLGRGDVSPEDNARVTATKRLIESGQYSVNISALSDKLLGSVF